MPIEYQDSLYSSCASVEARQMGVTGQNTTVGVSPFLAESSTSEAKEVDLEQPKAEEEGNEKDEISSLKCLFFCVFKLISVCRYIIREYDAICSRNR